MSSSVGDNKGDKDEGAAGFDSQRSTGNPSSQDSTAFECNICLDTARDAVVSMCGHLFW